SYAPYGLDLKIRHNVEWFFPEALVPILVLFFQLSHFRKFSQNGSKSAETALEPHSRILAMEARKAFDGNGQAVFWGNALSPARGGIRLFSINLPLPESEQAVDKVRGQRSVMRKLYDRLRDLQAFQVPGELIQVRLCPRT